MHVKDSGFTVVKLWYEFLFWFSMAHSETYFLATLSIEHEIARDMEHPIEYVDYYTINIVNISKKH